MQILSINRARHHQLSLSVSFRSTQIHVDHHSHVRCDFCLIPSRRVDLPIAVFPPLRINAAFLTCGHTRIIDEGGTTGFVKFSVDFIPHCRNTKSTKLTICVLFFLREKTLHVMNAARDDLRAADQPPFAVVCGMPSIPAQKQAYTVL